MQARYLGTGSFEGAIKHRSPGSNAVRSLLLLPAYTSIISLAFFELYVLLLVLPSSGRVRTPHQLKRVSTFEPEESKLRTFHYRTIIYIISHHIMLLYFSA